MDRRGPILFQLFTHAQSSPSQWDEGNSADEGEVGAVTGIGKKLLQLPYVGGVASWVLPPAARLDVSLSPPLVSPSSKYVAILHQATVTILSKVDNFKEPTGICRGASRVEAYTHGVWLEEWDMVVVVSSQRSLHYLNVSGQEVDSLMLPNWKGSGQICGLFAHHASSKKGYEVVVLTSDGVLHYTLKTDKYDVATLSAVQWSAKKQHPQGVSGLHFHPGKSVLALVGPSKDPSTGGFSFSLWNLSDSPQLFWSNLGKQQGGGASKWFSGKHSPEKKPIVRVSPSAELVAVVDESSRLHVLSKKAGGMEDVKLGKEAETSSPKVRCWDMDKMDEVEWLAEDVMMVVRHDGAVNEVLVPSLVPLLDEVPPPFSPGCQMAQGAKGHTFVLDHLPILEDVKAGETSVVDKRVEQTSWRGWRLSSIVERSKEEMFLIKIKEGNYVAAMQLAQKYALDVDEVYKARWTTSDFGKLAVSENLTKVCDRKWVVRECLTRVCSTQEAMTSLLVYGLVETENNSREDKSAHDDETWWFRLERLRVLQYKDRLETFLGMHNGRYFAKEYAYFRSANLRDVACEYAEGGRVGALDVLLKRHSLSLAPSVLAILDAIPETLSPHSYSKLLPELTPPRAFLVRGESDWVESRKTVAKLNTGSHALVHMLGEVSLLESTEHMVKLVQGLLWPSESEITEWYRGRAHAIDRLSGQLENSLSLLDWGQRKGVTGLDLLFEDVADLIKVVVTGDNSEDSKLEMALDEWELLSEYEKFQVMLEGVQADSVVDRLREQALPFLQRHRRRSTPSVLPYSDSPALFSSVLGTWLRDLARQNKLEVCAAVFEEAASASKGNDLFENEFEMVGVAVDCIYLCPALDQWSLMKTILSRFTHNLDSPVKNTGVARSEDTALRGRLRRGIVSRFRSSVSSNPSTNVDPESGSRRASLAGGDPRLQQADALVESGELLALYQVGTPMKFLANCEEDVTGTKELLRTLLLKFSHRQPARSDGEWMVLWRDLTTLQEKAFPFLEKEYLLDELCRGLLQAGKFSLAKNYLTGTGSTVLHADKAEQLVLDTARDFFYSAPSLDSSAIEMARNCLALVPGSKAVTAEENMIEAVTIKLPMLGVTLLPLEVRQVKDKMDVLRMALSAHSDAYLNLPELMEIAMLLGLDSPGDKANVEAAIAREAAAAGDFDLARDLCLGLVKKGHGAIWDLCAALARGPEMSSIDLNSRKGLLGFALAHCDEESVGELLVAWKDADMLEECHKLGLPSTGQAKLEILSAPVLEEGCRALSEVTVSDETSWDLQKGEHRKLASFACYQVPWLLKTISSDERSDNQLKEDVCHALARECSNPSSYAAALIVYGVASYDMVWSDNLVAKLAQEALSSGSRHGDKAGCGYLMNMRDAYMGAEVLEQEVGRRHVYEESVQAMHMSRLYAAVQDASLTSSLPHKRREILLSSLSSLSESGMQDSDSSGWRHRRVRTEEKLKEMGQARTLERMIPGADFRRFALGDREYISHSILELVGPCARKTRLTDVLSLAEQYSVDTWQVLMRYMETLFQSEMATEDDIASLLEHHGQQLLQRPEAVLNALIPTVYSALDGVNKKRLHYYFQVISECSSSLEKDGKDIEQKMSDYWKAVADESLEASKVAQDLDFKRIAGLESLNHSLAMEEIVHHVNRSNVAPLAAMIGHLHDFAAGGRFPTSEEVYMAFIGKVLGVTFAESSQDEVAIDKPVDTVETLDIKYSVFCHHLDQLSAEDTLRVVEAILCKSVPICDRFIVEEPCGETLLALLALWTRVFGDAESLLRSRQQASTEISCQQVKALHTCCKTFTVLAKEKTVSGKQGWEVVNKVVHSVALLRSDAVSMKFLSYMVLGGCPLSAVLAVADCLSAEDSPLASGKDEERLTGPGAQYSGSQSTEVDPDNQSIITNLYLQILESALPDIEGTGKRSVIAVLTSLASDGNLEECDRREQNIHHHTQQSVWQCLSASACNLQIPPRTRINILELQEALRTGQLKGLDGLPLQWGDWDSGSTVEVDRAEGHEVSQSQSSLAALKSTELVRHLWPNKQITNQDLSTVDAATALFNNLIADASTQEHVLALRSLLVEWDTVFEAEPTKNTKAGETESWEEPEWGEGWEECEDDTTVHALHLCWATVLQRLAVDGCMKEVLQVLDGALAHPSTPLVNREEAEQLVSSVGAHNALSGLKLSLLLPYGPPQASALSKVEEEIKQAIQTDTIESSRSDPTNPGTSSVDEELIGLLIAAGVLPSVAGDAELSHLFAAICKTLGALAWRLQEHQLERLQGSKSTSLQGSNSLYLVTFPLFVAELARARLYPVAGALVMQFMRVPPALMVWNAAYVALKQYLSVLCEPGSSAEWSVREMQSNPYLPYTMQHLASRLKEVPQAGLSVLVKDMKPL